MSSSNIKRNNPQTRRIKDNSELNITHKMNMSPEKDSRQLAKYLSKHVLLKKRVICLWPSCI